MAQKEHTQKCSNSSGGGGGGSGGGNGGGAGGNGSLKKLKQKKVPQRGLGVAQLEKIRLEEQQKKIGYTILSPNSIISSSNSSSSLAVQCPNFRPNLSPSPIPLPPPLPTRLPSPNYLFSPASLVPSIDFLPPNSIPLSKPTNVGGGEIGWSEISGSGNGNRPKSRNGEYNHEEENHRFGFRQNLSLPYESNSPIWSLPSNMQRSQQFQQPSSSSMLNVQSGTSSSSEIKFQMEPPSNQSYCGNNYTSLWPEEEKMVGMKRPYPFTLDNAPGPSFNCRFPPTFVPPISRSDESASCSNGGTISVEPANPVFREHPSSSSAISEPNPKKVINENGDFLTLAPPATAQPHLSSKQKHPSSYLSLHNRELSEYESFTYKGSNEEPINWPVPGGSIQQFFSSFPSANAQIGQATTTINNSDGDVEEGVDLNLKL